MITSDRRLQEGSQALGIAFNIARAQEALYRVAAGEPLASDEQVYFERIASLFAKARDGFHWVDSLTHGTPLPFNPDTADQLQALRLLLPVIASSKPEESFSSVAEVARQLRDGKPIDESRRSFFNGVLEALGTYAVAEGSDALESSAVVPPFSSFE
jgi:hypothetical protein